MPCIHSPINNKGINREFAMFKQVPIKQADCLIIKESGGPQSAGLSDEISSDCFVLIVLTPLLYCRAAVGSNFSVTMKNYPHCPTESDMSDYC